MSFPKYPAYTDSGVEWIGEIPAHWSLQRCKQVFIERDERSETGEEMLLSVSAYTGISPRGEIINDGDFLSRAQSLVGYKICYPNDLVMNIMLAWNRGLGFSNYYGIVSPAYSVFKLLPGNCTRFLDYLVRSDEAILYYKAFSSGVIDSRLRLYPNIFGSLYYALPPLAEQQAIASFLDRECGKIDGLIAEQERLIALLAEKRQAVISHAVTKGLNPNVPMKDSGIPWIGVVPAHWSSPPLYMRYSSELGKMLDTKRISGKHPVPYLRNIDVQWGVINFFDLPIMDISVSEYDRYTIQTGDLLVCEGGEVGRAAVVKNAPATIGYQKALHRLRRLLPDELPPYMFYIFFSAVKAGAFAGEGQSTIAHLTGEQLRKYRFPKPPFVEQKLIVQFLDRETTKLDRLECEAGLAVTLLKERRTTLISAAVTGKIDVRAQSKALAA